jgi:hypothetical protein
MRLLRYALIAVIVLIPGSLYLVAPASAAPRVTPSSSNFTSLAVQDVQRHVPFPSCGDHFQFYRKGDNVRVVGTDLKVFSKGYMLVWAAANGNAYGPYNASPNGGANFTIDTGSSHATTISITLTNDEDTAVLCAQDYYA